MAARRTTTPTRAWSSRRARRTTAGNGAARPPAMPASNGREEKNARPDVAIFASGFGVEYCLSEFSSGTRGIRRGAPSEPAPVHGNTVDADARERRVDRARDDSSGAPMFPEEGTGGNAHGPQPAGALALSREVSFARPRAADGPVTIPTRRTEGRIIPAIIEIPLRSIPRIRVRDN